MTASITRRAVQEVAGELPGARQRRRRRAAIVAAAAVIVLATASVLVARPPLALRARVVPPAPPTAPVTAAVAPAPTAPAASPPVPVATLTTLLDGAPTDVDSAYGAIAARWSRPYERRPGERPCDAVRRSGLACLARRGSWNLVRRFDLPVVLELTSPSGPPRFLAVTSADEGRATVQLGSRAAVVPVDQLARDWDGSFVLLWRPPRAGIEPIGRGASGGDVAWLRQRLGAVDGQPVPARAPARPYDDALAARVTAFQRAHALEADGIAGEETLAKLTTMVDSAAPSLRRSRTGS